MRSPEAAPRDHPFWAEVDGDEPLPPATAHLGLRFLEAVPGSGCIRVAFEPKPEFANPRGQIQGGFLAAMLDDTLGAALATTLARNEFAVSLEIKVSFLRAASLGPVIGEGRVTRRGRSIAFVEGELRDEAEQVMATATSTARILASGATP